MKNSTFEGGGGDPQFLILISFIIGKHMKMLFFKFQQNLTTSKNYFFEGGLRTVAQKKTWLGCECKIPVKSNTAIVRTRQDVQ